MTLERLKKYILMGREIEFSCHRERYSITYSFEKDRQIISFFRFSQPCEDFASLEEFLAFAKIGGEYLREVMEQVEDIVVY